MPFKTWADFSSETGRISQIPLIERVCARLRQVGIVPEDGAGPDGGYDRYVLGGCQAAPLGARYFTSDEMADILSSGAREHAPQLAQLLTGRPTVRRVEAIGPQIGDVVVDIDVCRPSAPVLPRKKVSTLYSANRGKWLGSLTATATDRACSVSA